MEEGEDKCCLLASRQSPQSGDWRDWMSFSQCAADFSCLNALHDEAQIHNALSGFMCLPMSAVCGILRLLLLLLALCLFHGFLSMKALFHRLCFLSLLLLSLWSICHRRVDFFFSSRNCTLYNPNPICSWLSITEFGFFFCLCGIFVFLWCS